MRARTTRDLGALVRSTRRAKHMTQAELASRVGVSRDWVVRMEAGNPRVEAQKVLDVLSVLDLRLDVDEEEKTYYLQAKAGQTPVEKSVPSSSKPDPFDVVFARKR